MMRRLLRSNGGFTYVAALVMVVIVGIMSARAAEVWKTKMQREREIELISRGTQVRDALRRWYGLKPAQNGQVPANVDPKIQSPSELKDLLQDTRTASKARYLRAVALIDPMTGKDWALVKDTAQKIVGVKSTSEEEPIKQANFPFDLEPADFEGKKKYSEWQFICTRSPAPPTGSPVPPPVPR
ncbi:MAG TPA: type II secretion system pseudopilin [Geobacter sp.]|nr:type II secretion system pseudopilin [Geobacter sp.]